MLQWLQEIFKRREKQSALIQSENDERVLFEDLEINPILVGTPKVAGIVGDYTYQAVSTLLEFIQARKIIVPVANTVSLGARDEIFSIAGVQFFVTEQDVRKCYVEIESELYRELVRRDSPGLVLFSSGSTGKPKAAVHDFGKILEKFKTPRKNLEGKVMMVFLMFDHIGGINTLFTGLSNGMTLVACKSRDPRTICEAIQKYRVQILPTTPTFLNLLLLHGIHQEYDLSSLEMITYGTEPMPEATLRAVAQTFPNVKLQQTFGLSEIGIMRTKSRETKAGEPSLWVKIGGEGYQWRVCERGLLEIKAESAMLGYLNAPSPFTEDGWFKTNDAVEVDGEWLRILGRQSELINVGGEKVWPAEVEGLLSQIPGVEEVVVSKEQNPLTGHIVKATVCLKDKSETSLQFTKRMRVWCRERGVPEFKVPQRVKISKELLHTDRMKKDRTL